MCHRVRRALELREAARFHDQRAPERRRSVYGRRGVAEDVVLSAYDIGLLRIHQQGRLLKSLNKDTSISDTSAPVVRATLGVSVAQQNMQALHQASTVAERHRSKFVYYHLLDPAKPTMVRYICLVLTLTFLAYYSSTGNVLRVLTKVGGVSPRNDMSRKDTLSQTTEE